MYKDFTEMPVWIAAMEIAVEIFNMSNSLPKSEDYALTSQIRRSAESISANISEAFGRYHVKDKIKFYYYAKGSAHETKSHLIYGNRIKYFNDNDFEKILNNIEECIHHINKIIKALSNSQP